MQLNEEEEKFRKRHTGIGNRKKELGKVKILLCMRLIRRKIRSSEIYQAYDTSEGPHFTR